MNPFTCGKTQHMFRAKRSAQGDIAVEEGTVCTCGKRKMGYRMGQMQSLWLSAPGKPVDGRMELWEEDYAHFDRVAERIQRRAKRREHRRLALEAGSYLGALGALFGYILHSDPLFLFASVLLAAYALERKTWAFVVLNVVWGTFALERILR